MVWKKENSLKASVIILNWNGKRFIENCINSIKASDLDSSNYEIIIADNCSSDNSINLIKEKYPQVRLIEFKDNYGFCKGNNLAARHARGETLFFLNNDTKVEPNTMSRMLAKIESNGKIAICGCKMLNYSGTVTFHAGIGIDVLGWPVLNRKLFYVEGSALMIKKSIFERLGGFDEDYFMFHEDVDLCWRTRLMGYRIATAEDAVVYHFMGASAGGGESGKAREFVTTTFRKYYSEKNTISTLLKNYSFPYLTFVLPLYLAIAVIEIIVFSFLGKFNVVKVYLNAYKWVIQNIRKILIKRANVQRSREISDAEIFRGMYKLSGKLLILKEYGFPKIKG